MFSFAPDFHPSSEWERAPRFSRVSQPYPYPSPNVARDRYLAALAEARNAQAEYDAALAAEERRRIAEERRRLAEEDALRAYYSGDAYHPFMVRDPADLYGAYGPYERLRMEDADRRAALEQRRQGQKVLDFDIRPDLARRSEPVRTSPFDVPFYLPQHKREPESIRPSTDECSHSHTPQHRREPSLPRQQPSTSKPNFTPSTSLRSKLEGRLQNEQDSEVRDALQSILGSVSGTGSTPISIPITEPKPTAIRKERSRSPQAQATPRAASPTHSQPQIQPQPHRPTTPPTPVNPLERISQIAASFTSLQSNFTLPAKLDFSATTTPSMLYPHLAFTSTNTPVHAHAHALNELLDALDTVESAGVKEVRERRKEVVRGIERALEVLERTIKDKWEAEQTVEEAVEKVEAPTALETIVEETMAVTPEPEPVSASLESRDATAAITLPPFSTPSDIKLAASQSAPVAQAEEATSMDVSESATSIAELIPEIVIEGDIDDALPVTSESIPTPSVETDDASAFDVTASSEPSAAQPANVPVASQDSLVTDSDTPMETETEAQVANQPVASEQAEAGVVSENESEYDGWARVDSESAIA